MSEFPDMGLPSGLNEVQFPKELQQVIKSWPVAKFSLPQ